MKVFVLFLVIGASLVSTATASGVSTAAALPKHLESGAVQTSRYVGPAAYPGYYLYNYVQVDPGRGIPIAVFADGSQGVAHVQPTYTYFGTPVYDHRYFFNQVFPGFPGFQPPAAAPVAPPQNIPGQGPIFPPQNIPGQGPIYPPQNIPSQGPIFPPTTQRPPFDEDDGIEKLDEKVDPSLGATGGAHPNDDEDTVTIDAI